VPHEIQMRLARLHCDSTRTRERVDKALAYLKSLPMKGMNESKDKKVAGKTKNLEFKMVSNG